eukprot:Gregarina_sp_Poly_1__2284@NODE_1607_length_3725_cov_62_124385_g1059_i0_p1_GENE_NODE_1607_length_3725_cov_62_124385_g1059_i0NODE_1607_length_3725_cov_62_124385_g1059_i0_p1_ORF_typecomplete_len690_score109_97Sin_N/PF04801_13/1_5e35_NODE_1607_length_3725_cov_62_124385_g1059_i015973666
MAGLDSTDKIEDDPIIREIPVYLNRLEQHEGSDFYVLQYPLRPVYRPYGDHGQLCRIQRRAESKRLRLTYALNVEGDQFDESCKAQINSLLALKADNKLTDKDAEELDALGLHRLDSTFAKNEGQCEYAIGFVSNGAFFLTPVGRVLQFRPDFGYIDRAMDLAKARVQQLAVKTGGPVPTTGEPVKEEAVDAALQSRLQASHIQVRQRELEEPLQDVEVFFDPDSPESAEILAMLSVFPLRYRQELAEEETQSSASIGALLGFNDDVETEVEMKPRKFEIRTRKVKANHPKIPQIIFDDDLQGYLKCLSAGCAESTLAGTKSDDATAGVQTGPLSWLALSRMNTEQQVERIMRVRQIETFSQVKAKLTSDSVPDDYIIECLLKVAYPLKGSWVVKSDVLFDVVTSRWTPVEILSRELLLCFMANNVPGKNIMDWRSKSALPVDRLNALIQSLYSYKNSQLVPNMVPEPGFEAAHPQLFSEALNSSLSRNRAGKLFAALEEKAKEERSRMASAGASGAVGRSTLQIYFPCFFINCDFSVDLLDRVLVKNCIEKVLKKFGASTDTFITDKVQTQLREHIELETRQRIASAGNNVVERSRVLEEMAKKQTALEKLGSNDLRDVLIQTAETLGGLWIVKELGSNFDPYRRVVLELFRRDMEKGITKKEFRDECTKVLKKVPDFTDVGYRQIFR